MAGGEGADTFVFGQNHGNDTITDFDTANDKIDISALGDTITWELLSAKITNITDDEGDVTGVTVDLSDWDGGTITINSVASTDLNAGIFDLEDEDTSDETTESTVNNNLQLGTDADDTLTGSEENDAISGGAGDDTIYGGGGDDAISGGSDDDTIYGGAGDDTILGDAGDDTIYGGADNDTIYGGPTTTRSPATRETTRSRVGPATTPSCMQQAMETTRSPTSPMGKIRSICPRSPG